MHHCALIVFVVDVITIDKTGENFRLLYDVKGRFTVHRVTNEEAKVSVGILVTLSLIKMSPSLTMERLIQLAWFVQS